MENRSKSNATCSFASPSQGSWTRPQRSIASYRSFYQVCPFRSSRHRKSALKTHHYTTLLVNRPFSRKGNKDYKRHQSTVPRENKNQKFKKAISSSRIIWRYLTRFLSVHKAPCLAVRKTRALLTSLIRSKIYLTRCSRILMKKISGFKNRV